MDMQLFEVIFEQLEKNGPTSISCLVDNLRGQGWRRLPRDFADFVQEAGFEVRYRRVGQNLHTYVHHSDFTEVKGGAGGRYAYSVGA